MIIKCYWCIYQWNQNKVHNHIIYVLFYFDNVKGEFLWGKDEKVLQIRPPAICALADRGNLHWSYVNAKQHMKDFINIHDILGPIRYKIYLYCTIWYVPVSFQTSKLRRHKVDRRWLEFDPWKFNVSHIMRKRIPWRFIWYMSWYNLFAPWCVEIVSKLNISAKTRAAPARVKPRARCQSALCLHVVPAGKIPLSRFKTKTNSTHKEVLQIEYIIILWNKNQFLSL